MTNKLEQAALALLAHWDTPAWRYLKPTGDLMADLREALAEQAEQEPSIDFNKLHEMNMQYVECPACGSDMARAYSPKKQAKHEPMKECRHCGFLCKPNPNESGKWYPLEQAEQRSDSERMEPVAWRWRDIDGLETIQSVKPYHDAEPLYAAPFNCKGKCCE